MACLCAPVRFAPSCALVNHAARLGRADCRGSRRTEGAAGLQTLTAPVLALHLQRAQVIIKDKSLTIHEADTKGFMLQAFRGLEYLHQNWILHRVRPIALRSILRVLLRRLSSLCALFFLYILRTPQTSTYTCTFFIVTKSFVFNC